MNLDEESKDIYISDQELNSLFSAWNSQVGRPPNEQEAINNINDFIEEEIYKDDGYFNVEVSSSVVVPQDTVVRVDYPRDVLFTINEKKK